MRKLKLRNYGVMTCQGSNFDPVNEKLCKTTQNVFNMMFFAGT